MIRTAPRYSRLTGIAGRGSSNRIPRPRMGFTGLGSVGGSGVGGLGIGSLGVTGQQAVMSMPQIAGATLTTASAMGASWATAAIPIVGPIIAGVTVGLSFLFARKGPKQKVATTEIVDKVEPLLVQNLEGYLSGPRTVSS